MKLKIFNTVLALLLAIAPMQSVFAWSWGNDQYRSSSIQENYHQKFNSGNTQNINWWSNFTSSMANAWTNVSSFLGNAFNTIKNFTFNIANFVMHPIASIEAFFNKSPDIAAPPVENMDRAKSVTVELTPQALEDLDSKPSINYDALTDEQQAQIMGQAWEVKTGTREEIDYKAILGDDYKADESSRGKLADIKVDVNVEMASPEPVVESTNVKQLDPSMFKGAQTAATSRSLAQEDMVSIETYKRRQVYIDDQGNIYNSGAFRQGFESDNEKLRFNAKGNDSIYEAKVFDNGNQTATVDMPLNWFSPKNVAKALTLPNSNIMADVTGNSFPILGTVNNIFKGVKSIYTANKRWVRSVNNNIDKLANTINSNKFQIVEVPGVNSEGLGPEKLAIVKEKFGLAANQTLVIAHSAGTDLTARTLSQIDTTNREVFVLFLSPRMNYKKLEYYIAQSKIGFDNIVTVNAPRDFPHWSNRETPNKFITGYLHQDKWSHLFFNKDVTNDGYRILDHGSMYNGLHNGRKYQIITNLPLTNENRVVKKVKDIYRGLE